MMGQTVNAVDGALATVFVLQSQQCHVASGSVRIDETLRGDATQIALIASAVPAKAVG